MVNAIHIGIIIKDELCRQNIPVSLLAKKINRSRNVIYDIFKRKSIDTELLTEIGKVLNCDFFSLYSAQSDFSGTHLKRFNNEYMESCYAEKLAVIVKQNQILENEIIYLKKIVALLDVKKRRKSQ